MKQQHNSRRWQHWGRLSFFLFYFSPVVFHLMPQGYRCYLTCTMNASQWHENWMSAQECHASEVGSKLSLCTKGKTCTLQHSNCRHLQLSKEQTVCTTNIINVSWILESFICEHFQNKSMAFQDHCFSFPDFKSRIALKWNRSSEQHSMFWIIMYCMEAEFPMTSF